MLQKRGAIEIQFNWIFILIIGVIILGFFISIINKQKTIAEDQISASIKINLGAVLTGSRASAATASRINIPNIDIIYDCDGYIVGKANAIRAKTSFSPELIKGPVIMSWTHEWSMPFRVTNFLYITSPFVRYVFVNIGSVAEEVYDIMPNRTIIDHGEVKAFFTKELVESADILNLKDQNHYKVRFVFFGGTDPASYPLPKLGGVKRKDYTAVRINANSLQDIQGTGELVFYEKKGDRFEETAKSVFIGEASAIGSIFTDDPETYECNMQMAFNMLQIVNTIYWDRANMLKSHYQTATDTNNCQIVYTNADSFFRSINQSARRFTPAYASSLKSAADAVMRINEDTLQRSCPAIY